MTFAIERREKLPYEEFWGGLLRSPQTGDITDGCAAGGPAAAGVLKHKLENMKVCIGQDLKAKVGYKTLSRISAAGAVPSEAA